MKYAHQLFAHQMQWQAHYRVERALDTADGTVADPLLYTIGARLVQWLLASDVVVDLLIRQGEELHRRRVGECHRTLGRHQYDTRGDSMLLPT